MSVIARPGSRGPYSIADLPAGGAYDPRAAAVRPCDEPLLRRAATAYMAMPRGSEERRKVEYISARLRSASPSDAATLAGELAHVLRRAAA